MDAVISDREDEPSDSEGTGCSTDSGVAGVGFCMEIAELLVLNSTAVAYL